MMMSPSEKTPGAESSEALETKELLSSLTRELENIQTRIGFIEETLRTKGRRRFFGLAKGSFFGKDGLSIRWVIISATILAAILGAAIYWLVRGFQWSAALADLRSEPGIHILSVRKTGLFTTEVTGLRDPLAPDPLAILEKHNIAPGQIDLHLIDYPSVNTVFDRQRKEAQAKELETLRAKMIRAVGALSEENREQRENELGKISQILLELRFPEAMKKLELKYDDGVWYAKGKLLANEYLDFKALAPSYILNGKVDFEHLGDFTEAKSAALKSGIETPNLLEKDFSGDYAHVARVARLVRDYDALMKHSGVEPERLRFLLRAAQADDYGQVMGQIADLITDGARLDETRIRLLPPEGLEKAGDPDSLRIQVGFDAQ